MSSTSNSNKMHCYHTHRDDRDAAVNFGRAYVSKFTAASRSFHCNSNVFESNNSISHGKITVLNMSIYCLKIHYLTYIVCAINIACRSVIKPECVAEIDDFAVFPLPYLRTFEK